MNRIDRLLGIITLLQTKKFVAAEKIADKFNISTRTVYRDVKAIAEQGIPVSFEPHKGYFIVQGYFLPPVSFSSEEANALVLMEAVVERFADKSIINYYTTALDKIKAVLRQQQKEKLEHLKKNIKLQTCHPDINSFEYLAVLQNAIAGKTILIVDYQNNQQEVSKRKVEPIGLIFYAYNWHLVGWCHNRKSYRDFRVSRILKVKDSGLLFENNNHIELAEYMKQLPVAY